MNKVTGITIKELLDYIDEKQLKDSLVISIYTGKLYIPVGKVNIDGYFIKMYPVKYNVEQGFNIGDLKSECHSVRNDDTKIKSVFVKITNVEVEGNFLKLR